MIHATTVNQAGGALSDGKRHGGRTSESVAGNAMTQSGRWRKGRRVYDYQTGSWWSHLLYGLGMLVFLVAPPLLHGNTVTGLIKGYMGFLVISLGIVCVWGMLRTLHTPARGNSTRL